MTPYSQDLRERILETVQRGEGSLRQIAQRFLVSLSFVVRLLQTYRRTGSIQPRPHRGGNTDAPGKWDAITLTCGLRLSGVTAALAFPGATNTDMFETYVAEVLVPELKPGDVVVWDNPKPHLSDEAIEAVEAAGARVVPLPPYSPDLTPIEEMISKV